MRRLSHKPLPKARVRARLKSLGELGVAVEHHPRYVNQKYAPHTVDALLLSYIAQGQGSHYMGDEIYEEQGGCLGITHLGQTHDILTSRDGVEVFNLFLDVVNFPLPPVGDQLQDVLAAILPLRPEFSHKAQRRVHLRFDDPEEPTVLLRAMNRELHGTAPGRTEIVRSYLCAFLGLCCRTALKYGFLPSEPGRSSTEGRLESLRQHLDAHYAEQHTLKELAARAGLTPNYLCRAFRDYVGKTIFEYLVERRVQGAMLVLRSSNEKIIGVAFDQGFQSLPHFNRTFRRLAGVSPGEYRRKAGG